MLFDGPCVILMVKVAIMQVVDVTIVLDRRVSATCTVLVIVVFVDVRHHSFLSKNVRFRYLCFETCIQLDRVSFALNRSRLTGMSESVCDQFRNMFITEFVEDVLPFTGRFHNPFAFQQLQPL